MLEQEEFLKLLIDHGLALKDVSELVNDGAWKTLDNETLHRTLRVASVNKILMRKKGCEPLRWATHESMQMLTMMNTNTKKVKIHTHNANAIITILTTFAYTDITEKEEVKIVVEVEDEEEVEEEVEEEEEEEVQEKDEEEFLKMKTESTGGAAAGLTKKEWRSIKGVYGKILGVGLHKKVYLALYEQCGCAEALKLCGDMQKSQEYLEAELKKHAMAKIKKDKQQQHKKGSSMKKKNEQEAACRDLDKKARAIVREAAKICKGSI